MGRKWCLNMIRRTSVELGKEDGFPKELDTLFNFIPRGNVNLTYEAQGDLKAFEDAVETA